jgi:hypothetical protein
MRKRELRLTKLEAQCECFAAFVMMLPEDVRAMTLLTFEYPNQFEAALDEHGSKDEKMSAPTGMECEGESSDDEADASTTEKSAIGLRNEIKRLATSEAHLRSTNTQLTHTACQCSRKMPASKGT